MLFPNAHVQRRLQQQVTNTHYLKQAKHVTYLTTLAWKQKQEVQMHTLAPST